MSVPAAKGSKLPALYLIFHKVSVPPLVQFKTAEVEVMLVAVPAVGAAQAGAT